MSGDHNQYQKATSIEDALQALTDIHQEMEKPRDDIIRMAREAGLVRTGDGWTEPARWGSSEIEHFAELVAEHEREMCAKVCDEQIESGALAGIEKYRASFIAEAIRARGQA